MKKPIYLNEEVWTFLLDVYTSIPFAELNKQIAGLGYDVSVKDSKEDILRKIADNPSAFLGFAGLLDNPHLMKNMVLGIVSREFNNIELECVVTESAIKDLEDGKGTISLKRLDGSPHDVRVTRKELEQNLARNCEIDYLERDI